MKNNSTKRISIGSSEYISSNDESKVAERLISPRHSSVTVLYRNAPSGWTQGSARCTSHLARKISLTESSQSDEDGKRVGPIGLWKPI